MEENLQSLILIPNALLKLTDIGLQHDSVYVLLVQIVAKLLDLN